MRGTVVVVASQLLFWLFLFVIEMQTQPENMVLPDEIPMYLSDANGDFDMSASPILVPYVNEPAYSYRDTTGAPKALFQIEFEASADPSNIAFFVGWDGQLDGLILNGQEVPIGGKSFGYSSMSGYAPGIYRLPADFILPGKNTLGLINERSTNKFISHFAIGPYDKLIINYRWGAVIGYALPIAGIGAGFFILLICFLIPWGSVDGPRIVAFSALMIAALVRNLQFFGVRLGEGFPWYQLTNFMAVYALIFGLAAMAAAWSGGGWKSLRRIGVGYVFAVLLFCVALPFFAFDQTFLGFGHEFLWGWALEFFFTLLVAAFVFGRLFLASGSATNVRAIEYVIILFCVMIVLVEHIDHRFSIDYPFFAQLPIKNYITSIVSVVLPLGLCLTVSNETIRARRILANNNEILAQQLSAKENEIRNQARERAVVEERRRIMRDMHDGLGAILSGIVVQARSKQLPYEAVPQAVQSGLDELRLIIDSLDSSGDTLAVALGAFRERAAGYFTAAGIELHWDVDPGVDELELSATTVLQIYRILQEATTNIVNHSNASNAFFSVKSGREGSQIRVDIALEDDGIGFVQTNSMGKGLGIMKERARKIGGALLVEDIEPGIRVDLVLMLPSNSA